MPDPAKCPKYLPADNPAIIDRDLRIVESAAKGIPQGQIAAEIGMSRQRINQILSDEQAQEKLNNLIKLHISESESIQHTLISMAKGSRVNPVTAETETLSHTDHIKAIAEHNKIIGISSNHASQIVQNMLQINVAGGQVPEVIREFMGARDEVLPADYTGIDTQSDEGRDVD